MALENDVSFIENKKKKSKKRKHDKQDSEIDVVNMNKDDEKIKKKRKKTEIHQDVGDSGVCEEALDTPLDPDHTEKKKNKKNRKLKALEDTSLPSSDHVDMTLEDSDKSHKARKEKKEHKKKDECNIEMDDGKRKTEKKKKKHDKEKDNGDHSGEKEANDQDGDLSKEFEKKKRKREKKAMKDGLGCGLPVTENNNDVTDQVGKSSRKKTAVEENKNVTEQAKKKKRRVSFSPQVEVFPLEDDDLEKNQDKKLVQGKRFTSEENEKIKEAVHNYIKEHNLGENGLDMIMHCQSHRGKLRNCWKEIGLALPHRPSHAVYYRAHILFERDENRKWSKEDLEIVRKFHAEHGPKWKKLSEITGRHRIHIKDTWRRIRYLNKKSGHWSQDEYQDLFELVHSDLKLKVFEDKKSKHGMLRDNIGWGAISDTLTTRTDATCCEKWYRQLSSPMVAEGIWADTDDYLLLGMLFNLDACSVEEVDWDNLIEHRPGDVCRKRWNQMVRHIGSHKQNSFPEQVELLSQRYKLDMLEARKIWDNKPYTS